jgi:hypothetical protein
MQFQECSYHVLKDACRNIPFFEKLDSMQQRTLHKHCTIAYHDEGAVIYEQSMAVNKW